MSLIPVFNPNTGASGGPSSGGGSGGGTDFMNLPYEVLNLNTDGYTNHSADGRSFTNVSYDGNGVGSYTYSAPGADGHIFYTVPLYSRDENGDKILIQPTDNFRMSIRLSETIHSGNASSKWIIVTGMNSLEAGFGTRLAIQSRVNKDQSFVLNTASPSFTNLGGSSGRSAEVDGVYLSGNLQTASGIGFNAANQAIARASRNNAWTNPAGTNLFFMFTMVRASGYTISDGDVLHAKVEFKVYKFT